MTVATLQDALSDIYAIEALLAISFTTSGGETYTVAAGGVRSKPFFPPTNETITDTPAILHKVTPSDIRYESGGWTMTNWSVRCYLLSEDLDYGSEIATAFIEPLRETFARYIKLNQREGWAVMGMRFNGDQPVPYVVESSGKFYYALDYYIDLKQSKTITIAAGSLP